MSISPVGNLYPGLFEGPIDHNASSVINAICGDFFLATGEVVRELEIGSASGKTPPGSLLPRVGIPKTSGDPAYGVVVGGQNKGIFADGKEFENIDLAKKAGIVAGLQGDSVRVVTQGRCLAEIVNRSNSELSINTPLTGDRDEPIVFGAFKKAESGDFVLARLLQEIPLGTMANPVLRIAAVDVQREGILP